MTGKSPRPQTTSVAGLGSHHGGERQEHLQEKQEALGTPESLRGGWALQFSFKRRTTRQLMEKASGIEDQSIA